jgi:methylthioribose-1-phosphate isomerase
MGHALGIIEEAYVNGLDLMVVSKETRPRSQGYRLTVWELNRAGVPVTIVTDNMISISMERMGINMVLLGADRVAADGSVANKVGSADIARIAKDYDVPFYFATSYTTISPEVTDGNSIPIEERSIDEITEPYRLLAKELKESNKISSSALDEWPPTTCLSEKKPMRGQVRLYNPAFDITPPNLIRGIVTDLGLFQPKEISNLTREKMAVLARERISNFLT